MSWPAAQLSSAEEEPKHRDQDSDQLELRRSAQNEDSKGVTPQAACIETRKEQFNALVGLIQTPAD